MKYIYSIILSLFFIGCVGTNPKVLHVKNLGEVLYTLDKNINKKEAYELGNKLVLQSKELAKEYELVKPPLYHNFLVNIGLKKRGLCWQFAYDILDFTLRQNYKSFDYYIGGANINDYWQEHNVLVITCKGCKFKKGIVIDPWRNSGELYFSKLTKDKSYIWTQRGGIRNERR